jgi:hypothetical protein
MVQHKFGVAESQEGRGARDGILNLSSDFRECEPFHVSETAVVFSVCETVREPNRALL